MEPQDAFGHRIAGDGGELVVVTPDPFAGAAVEIEIQARMMPDRIYRDEDDVVGEWRTARAITLKGVVRSRS